MGKVWLPRKRVGIVAARWRVARRRRRMGLQGVVCGRPVKTAVSDNAVPGRRDRVSRQFRAARANPLRVAGFTDVLTWQGVVDVACSIMAIGGRCRTSRSAPQSAWQRQASSSR